MLNEIACKRFRRWVDTAGDQGCSVDLVFGAHVLDAGVQARGSLEAGLSLAAVCMGDHAKVSLVPTSDPAMVSTSLVSVRSDHPVAACLGAQYAGWPVQTDDFFAMGSGPMRMMRGRERMLLELHLREAPHRAVGVLEADQMPTETAVRLISEQCGVSAGELHLAIAPSTSIAGNVQVVARSVETALHKLHELKFDVRTVLSAAGFAPLPPPAKRGDAIGGIGRTNDAILYGGTVTLWTDCEDDAIAEVIDKVPSHASADFGQPFAKIFEQYDHDFYKVDPLLFSPAVVTFHNLRSGRSFSSGKLEPDVLRQSFHS